uniref:Uncharacterized protein n=1 Tax=Plectus sambesii TaxID=2011161 RepID=A0A914WIM2_9BILA
MQLILVISLCTVTAYAQSYANLRFTHPIIGELKVSTERYPMLTPVESPEIVYITPSTQELNAINGKARGKMVDLSLQSKVSSFLVTEFENDVVAAKSSVIDESQLPFKSFGMASDIEMHQIPKATYAKFMQFYLVMLKNKEKSAWWFPAQQIYTMLGICRLFQFNAVGKQDILFQSDNGGIMVYFKTTCTHDRSAGDITFGLSYYSAQFTLAPVAKPTQITQEWNSIMDASKKTLTTNMRGNSGLTAKQIRFLLDFFQGLVQLNVRNKFGSYLSTS